MSSNGVLSQSLVESPFISQVREIQLDRIVNTQKLVNWFTWLEVHSEWAVRQFEALSPREKGEFRCVQRVFETICDRRFSLQTDPKNLFRPTLAETFQALADFVRVVIQGHVRGLMVVGGRGNGKSHTLLETLKEEGLVAGQDYERVTGYTSALGLYNKLSRKPDGLFIFDDCDSVFKDSTGVNILKAVLDTLPVRTVSWESTSNKSERYNFEFTGRIIFISNEDPAKNQSESFQALTTRVLTLLVGASPEEILHRCLELLPRTGAALTPDQREDVANFLRENYLRIRNFSVRTMVNIVGLCVYSPQGWQNLARYVS